MILARRRADAKAAPRVSNPSSVTPAPKLQKPHPDFPLFPHQTGRWAKKVKGKTVYFGYLKDDPDGQKALEAWLDQKDAILAGRKPRVAGSGYTVKQAINDFLNAKKLLVRSGEMKERTHAEYVRAGNRAADVLNRTRLVQDLDAEDFRMLRDSIAKHYGAVALGNEIQRIRTIFRFCYEEGKIDRPVRFGSMFKKPSASTLRKARARAGLRMFEAEELRRIIDAARPAVEGDGSTGGELRFRTDRHCEPAQGSPGSGRRMGQLPAAEDRNPATVPTVARDHYSRARGDPQSPQADRHRARRHGVQSPHAATFGPVAERARRIPRWFPMRSAPSSVRCSSNSTSTATGLSTRCDTASRPSPKRRATCPPSSTSWATSTPA